VLLLGLWWILRPGPPVNVKAFRAEPASVSRGGTVKLSWEVADAESVELEGLGKQNPNGATNVVPNETTTYTLIARPKRGEEIRRKLEVSVVSPASARITRFEVSPDKVKVGEPAILRWDVENGKDVTLDGVTVAASGSQQLMPSETKTYTLEAAGPDGARKQMQALVSVEARQGSDRSTDRSTEKSTGIVPATGLRIESFEAQPSSIQAGQSVTLHWRVTGASRVSIAPDPGAVALQGELKLSPRDNARYVLTAVDSGGRSTTATAMVSVTRADSPGPTTNVLPQPSARFAWQVAHDHQGLKTLNPYDRDWDHCEGVLRVVGKVLRYDTKFAGDSFESPLSEVGEVKMNRFGIRKMKTFHVKLRSGRNFNFVAGENSEQIVNTLQKLIP
jgi:hypothetical protein